MKRIVILIAILLILGFVGVSKAQQIGLSVPRWSVGSGESTTGGDYKLSTISNQPIAGSQSGGDFQIKWGFWQPIDFDGLIYLPMVAKLDAQPSSFGSPNVNSSENQ